MTVDVTRADGEVTEAGDTVSAANLNDLENRIASGIEDAQAHYRDVTIAATASAAMTGYTHAQAITWTGCTADHDIDIIFTVSGSVTDIDWLAVTATDLVTLYFKAAPAAGLTARVILTKEVESEEET